MYRSCFSYNNVNNMIIMVIWDILYWEVGGKLNRVQAKIILYELIGGRQYFPCVS